MKAIPTKYGGIQFRSRLEARWAAFFDLVNWPWEYEPIDLDGYLPDFILKFTKPVLVEVKPLTGIIDPTNHVFVEAVSKINESGWDDEAIVVGTSLDVDRSSGFDFPVLGRFAMEEHGVGDGFGYSTGAVNLFTCGKCCRLSFFSNLMSYHCRVCGCGDGSHHLNPPHGIERLWSTAQNIVQWRGAASSNIFRGLHR